jgi:hypothetical protein
MWQGQVACVLSFIGVRKIWIEYLRGMRRIQGFGGEAWGKETTWETQA